MSTSSNSTFKYKVGGSLSFDDPTYVVRPADDELFDGLNAGEFCYVLNSRQTGKSSLLVRTMRWLEEQEQGAVCTAIDVSLMGGQNVTRDEWYAGFVNSLQRGFNLSINLGSWWRDRSRLSPLQRLSKFVEEELLPQVSQNIVIFIDEIDSVLSLDFRDDFFAFIRACYNKRAVNPEYRRLTFALLGVATPYDLIQDKNRTPFNIGRAIELHGFSPDEVMLLAPGLAGKANNRQAAIKQVLYWTGGQPFLTQKLCKLIQSASDLIPRGNEAESIRKLVESQIILNWQVQDTPQHFKTIGDRILRSKDKTVRLLSLYQKILEKGEIPADDSPEQIELRLSGLVVKRSNSLRVYNPIYQNVFDLNWVKRELDNVRPYAQTINAWSNSNYQKSYLLKGQALQDAVEWAKHKSLGDQDYQFISASQESDRNKAQQDKQKAQKFALHARTQANRWRLAAVAAAATIASAIITGGIVWWKFTSCPFGQVWLNNGCLYVISSGESIVFRSEGNYDLESGVKAFKSGNYFEAKDSFEKAVDIDRNSPEPQIYLNNALARLKSSPFTLAVVVPVNNNDSTAEQMLRGVADAQTKFNKDGGLKGRLLEIIIANDGNEPKVAARIAKQLADNPDVLGVIGHNSSDASDAALPEYEKAGLAMVSPTSTSTSLKSEVFFRTVPSDSAAGAKLAKYAKTNLGLDKVVIFYDSKSLYSKSLQQAFEENFTKLGGSAVRTDLTKPNLDVKDEIEYRVNQDRVQAAVLLARVESIPVAISIAKANAELPQGQRLQLLGGDAMYDPYTLIQGGSAVEGLILAVPWLDETPYAEVAEKRWQGRVNWCTAASYDATQALIKALSSNATRGTVLQNLRTVGLSPEETSGDALRFFDGERSGEPRLVKVVEGAPSPNRSKFGFELLKPNDK